MTLPLCRLYLITPPQIADLEAFSHQLTEALSGGDVAALQVRIKPATDEEVVRVSRRLISIAHQFDVAVLVNDRPDLAREAGADGVHIGQGDGGLKEARRMVGPNAMVGVTCHDSRHLAMEAAEEGADYVAFGAFYPTTTKDTEYQPDPSVLTIWQETMETPCVAIGGITVDKAAFLAAQGADFLAVSSGVWAHPEGPRAAVAAFNAAIAAGVASRVLV